MDLSHIFTLFLIALSTTSLLLLLFIQVWLSNRFLKHPGELFFFSCIFLFFNNLKNFSYIANSDNDIKSNSIECKSIGFISTFAYFMQFNYMTALSIEIIIKINNNANQKHKIRMIIYHFYSIFSSLVLCTMILAFGTYGRDVFGFCSITKSSTGEKIDLIYVFCLLPIMWYGILLSVYKIRQQRKQFMCSLSMVILIFTLDWIFGRVFPTILGYFKIESYAVYEISTITVISSGTLITILRLLNKKIRDEIVERFKTHQYNKKKIDLRRKMKSGELNQILRDLIDDESYSSLGIDDFSGNLFDNITKRVIFTQVLLEIFVLTSLKFKKFHISPISDDSVMYKFKYSNYTSIASLLKLKIISSSNFYPVFTPSLCIKEYFPLTFSSIRAISGISNQIIYESLCHPENFNKIRDLETQNGGKSNSIIITTADQLFVIKTISKSERKFFLREFIEDYVKRLHEKGSRIVRIFGVFSVKPSKQSVILMENIIQNRENAVIFDIKGSSANRFVEGIDDPQRPPYGVVLKDVNFKLFEKKIFLGHKEKYKIVEELKKDFLLMASKDLMDYSILIAFYRGKNQGNRYCFNDKNGDSVAIGIIDILERYGISKKGEQKLKKMFNNSAKLSVAAPNKYYSRICKFTAEIFD